MPKRNVYIGNRDDIFNGESLAELINLLEDYELQYPNSTVWAEYDHGGSVDFLLEVEDGK